MTQNWAYVLRAGLASLAGVAGILLMVVAYWLLGDGGLGETSNRDAAGPK